MRSATLLRPLALALTAAGLALLPGCGGSTEHPSTVPVRGVVKHKGQPLTRGTITFQSEAGHTAVGEIGPDGTYTLSSFGEGDGAVEGQHRVMVVASDAEVNMMPGSTPGYKPPKELVPKKYNRPETSGLTAEVKKGQSEYDFDLP